MAASKKEYEKSLPILQVKQFERELNTFLMFKEKSDKLNKKITKKK